MRTLVIASAASASAAAITSQLWIRGTWIAAAVTPVLVALLSELLNRPTEKIAKVWTSDSPAVPAPPPRVEPPPSQPAERRPLDPVEPTAPQPGPGPAGPVKVYRQPAARPTRRRFAWGLAFATAGIAFVIGVVVLTTTELIAGGSIGDSNARFSIGASGKSDNDSNAEKNDKAPAEDRDRTTPDQDRQQTTPDRTTPTETTPTETTPTEATPQQETAPAPAPAEDPAGEPQSRTSP